MYLNDFRRLNMDADMMGSPCKAADVGVVTQINNRLGNSNSELRDLIRYDRN